MRLEILLVLALILVGGLIYYKDGGIRPDFSTFSFFGSATSTDEGGEKEPKKSLMDRVPFVGGNESGGNTTQPPVLTSAEIEEKVEKIYEGLDELKENARVDELYGPVSPFAGKVTLSAGNAQVTDRDKEYLTITANTSNTGPIAVTGWRVESYVTNSIATIPEGASLLDSHFDRDTSNIALAPGEQAYLITGETPLKVSFRENECSGYLAEHGTFYPSLQKSCPLPGDEMLQFANISSNDDDCFEFIEDIRRCEIVDSDEIDAENLSSKCEYFIESVLDYDGCVKKHEDDATFNDIGQWRIYLDKNGELWRSTKEIIRLLDSDDRVVDVVEY